MEEQKKPSLPNSEPPEESPLDPEPYVPRPKWQVAAAWFFLILVLVGTALYYYWIAHKY